MSKNVLNAKVIESGKTIKVYRLRKGQYCDFKNPDIDYTESELKFKPKKEPP